MSALRDAAYVESELALEQRNDLAVTLLYDTGLRPGRLLDLNVDMVDAERGELRVPEENGAGECVVELDPTNALGTRRLVLAYLNRQSKGTEALFPSRKADRLTVRGLRYVVKNLAESAGVRPYAPDGTRGTPADVTPQVIARSGRSDGGQTVTATGPSGRGRARSTALSSSALHGWEADGDALGNDPAHRRGDDLGGHGQFVGTALDTVVDMFYVLDTNGCLRRWNERVPEVTGYSAAELDGMHALQLVAEDDRETVAESLLSVFENRRTERIDVELRTKSGELLPYEVDGAPVTGPGGEVLGLAGVGRDITERVERERRLERYRRTLNAVGDGICQMDRNGRLVAVNDAALDVTGFEREELIGEHASTVVAPESVEECADTIRELRSGEGDVGTLEITVRTADGETVPAQARLTVLREDGEFQGTVGVVRDLSTRKARERELARQRDELRTLARINAVIRDVHQALIRARTQEGLEQAVCDTLVDSDPYRFAWIGDDDPGHDGIVPHAWAGDGQGYLDGRPGGEPHADDDVTASTAYHEDEIKMARNIAEDPEFASWREAALEHGHRSAIAVPLSYRDASHGVLCIYAPRPDAFDDRERGVLRELGETIAYALSAVERRRALVTDTVVQLELSVSDPGVFLGTLSERCDCELTLNGSVPVADGDLAAYVTVEGAAPESVRDAARTLDVAATVVESHGDEGLLRFEPAPRLATDLADHGGVVREAVAAEGSIRVTAEFPQDAETSTVLKAVEDRYADVSVLAYREDLRPDTTGAEFRAEVDDVFTDRQREVLKAAYLSGFFEWPRDSTGERIAETLGISTPTFHEHLRTTQRKLIETYFEG